MWPNPQETADLYTFTKEMLNGKLHFLCSVWLRNISCKWFLVYLKNIVHIGALVYWLSVLYNFNEQWLNSSSRQVQPLLVAYWRLAVVGNSSSILDIKSGLRHSSVIHSTKNCICIVFNVNICVCSNKFDRSTSKSHTIKGSL